MPEHANEHPLKHIIADVRSTDQAGLFMTRLIERWGPEVAVWVAEEFGGTNQYIPQPSTVWAGAFDRARKSGAAVDPAPYKTKKK